MKIGDVEVKSAGDAATVLLAVPAAFFGWVLWGDSSLVDPQVAAPLIGSAVLGVKKVMEVSPLAVRVRWVQARHRVKRTLFAVRSVSGNSVLRSRIDSLLTDLQGPAGHSAEPLVRDAQRDFDPDWERVGSIDDQVSASMYKKALKEFIAAPESASLSSKTGALRRHMEFLRERMVAGEHADLEVKLDRLLRMAPVLSGEQLRSEYDAIMKTVTIERGPRQVGKSGGFGATGRQRLERAERRELNTRDVNDEE